MAVTNHKLQITNPFIQVAYRVPRTQAEGPGVRYALWVQGCPLRCPGCCNPEFLPRSGGTPMLVSQLRDEMGATSGIEGVTFIGGEPMAQAGALAILAEEAHRAGLSVMVFTGYTLPALQIRGDPAQLRLLAATDVLVDGPYLETQRDTRRRWVGSRNQHIFFLSSRYTGKEPCWQEPNSVEIHLSADGIQACGFPVPELTQLFRSLDTSSRAEN